jgi:TPR repeat protein
LTGEGEAEDVSVAKYWLEKAAKNGSKDAEKILETLK